jgi:hypothetical protein
VTAYYCYYRGGAPRPRATLAKEWRTLVRQLLDD